MKNQIAESSLTPKQRKILEERARKTARKIDLQTIAFDHQDYVVFKIQNSCFAIVTQYVSEVITRPEITPLPSGPQNLLGLINLRGQVITVTNLSGLMPDASSAATANPNFAIILKNKSLLLGLAADEILENRKISPKELLSEYPGREASRDPHLLGVTRDQVLVLNLEYILNKKEIIIHIS